jgi:hypothetical protein
MTLFDLLPQDPYLQPGQHEQQERSGSCGE